MGLQVPAGVLTPLAVILAVLAVLAVPAATPQNRPNPRQFREMTVLAVLLAVPAVPAVQLGDWVVDQAWSDLVREVVASGSWYRFLGNPDVQE